MFVRTLSCIAFAANLLGCASPLATPSPTGNDGGNATAKPPIIVSTVVGRLAVFDAPAALDAPTVVLWPSVYADHRSYAPLAARWAGRYRVVLIDGPGHGASGPAPAAGFTMRDCAFAMKTVMDQLSISTAFVGGTSWGGLVGGEFAVAFPQATRGVVMLNTPVFAEPSFADTLIVLGTRLMGNTTFFAKQIANGFFLDETLSNRDAQVQNFFRHLAEKPKGELADAIHAVLVKRDALAPKLPQILAPTLFVMGSDDAMYPGDRLTMAARTISNVRIETVKSRHISVVDQPLRVGDLIEAFVDAVVVPRATQ